MDHSNNGSFFSVSSLAAALVAVQTRAANGVRARCSDATWSTVYAALRALVPGAVASRLVRRQDGDDLVHACVERLLQSDACFRGESDGEARAYLRTALRRAALDGYRKNGRERRKVAEHALFFEGVSHDDEGRVVMAAIELRRALSRCASAMGRRTLVAELDALGMLGWTERARLDDTALAALERCAPNALQARRSRLRKEIKRTCAQLVSAGAMQQSEANAVLALVTPDKAPRARGEDR